MLLGRKINRKTKSFQDLEIYKLAENLAVEIYQITNKNFPKTEIYGLTSQIRRAAVSVAINIAEGCGRFHFKDKSLFLYNARGSLLETKSLVIICYRLKFLKTEQNTKLIKDIDRLGVKINNLISYLKRQVEKPT